MQEQRRSMKKKKDRTTQEWIPIKNIFKGGIIKKHDDNYIKIIKISPINYNLKSIIEKESILNSYKLFLKTCNFNFQILIQSNREDLSKHIESINSEKNKNSLKIQNLSEKYINFIKKINNKNKSSNKKFYIIIEEKQQNKSEDIIIQELNDKYLKIKDCLSRCGNTVESIEKIEECRNILFQFLNIRLNNLE